MVLQIVSLVLSVCAAIASFFAATRAYRISVRPVLIFYNKEFDPDEETSWAIENAGNGPALNIIVAGDDGTHISENSEAVVIPSIPKGHSTRVGWLRRRNTLAATYSDVFGRKYTTTCSNNITTLRNRNVYPFLKGDPIFFHLRRDSERN